jgi:uncharacterized protein YraI
MLGTRARHGALQAYRRLHEGDVLMAIRTAISMAALATATALASPASAATLAAATTPLNIRSGPGPQFPVIGAIRQNGRALIQGCIAGSLWCEVNYLGQQGWAYSEYMTMNVAGRPMTLSEYRVRIPAIAYNPPEVTVGSAVVAAPPVSGTLVESMTPPPPLAITPPPQVRSYVIANPAQPVYLNGEVVTGAGLPPTVALNPLPNSDYEYAYVNRVPVLVEPTTRRIVYIYR